MKLYLKQHVFTWGDKFSVYDENGDEKYFVEGEIFTWGKKLHLYSLSGEELAFIHQKIFSFLPKYYIGKNGIDFAEIVKEFTFFKQKYTVNGPGWNVEGDFFSHEYSVFCGDADIIEVSKQWLTWGDTYEISIAPDIDETTALSVALVIDACISAERNNNN